MRHLLAGVFALVGCASNAGAPPVDASVETAADAASADARDANDVAEPEPCRHVGADAPVGMDATVDGERWLFCAGVGASARDVSTHRTIEIRGIRYRDPKIPDAFLGLDVTLELDPAIKMGASTSFLGTTTFHVEGGGDTVGPSDRAFAPDEGNDPAVKLVAAQVRCFCDVWDGEKQHVAGTITIDEWTSTRVRGRVHIDLTGNLAYWKSGEPLATGAAIDGAFDVAVTK